jgi:DNA-binding NarL/FixJ family response regulator
MTEHRPEANANDICIPPTGKESIERSGIVVLVADRLPAMREHVVRVLNSAVKSGIETIQAGDSAEALEVVNSRSPRLAVIETSLPGQSGLSIAKALWQKNPHAKILFAFTTYSEVHLRELDRIIPPNGVYGIVLKTIKENELAYAIDCLMVHDNTYIDPQIRAARNRVAGQECLLTDLELETLQDVALGLTDKAISMRRNISVRGVQSRVASLFSKLIRDEDDRTRSILGVEVINPRARLIFHAVRRGLLDLEQIDSWEASFASWLAESKQKGMPKSKDVAQLSPIATDYRQPRRSSFSA